MKIYDYEQRILLDRRILGAIIRHLDRMKQTRLFTDNPQEAVEFERIKNGGALVINLKLKSKDAIDLVVQTVLSKLREILEKGGSPLLLEGDGLGGCCNEDATFRNISNIHDKHAN